MFSATDTQNIREVAKALLHEIEQAGHICLHAQDWGEIKADMATIKAETLRTRDAVVALRDEVAQARGGKKMLATVAAAIGAIVGGAINFLAGR